MDWQDKALCKHYPEINFMPERPAPGRKTEEHYQQIRERVQPAIDVCKRCKVKQECFEYREQYKCSGVWGGKWFDIVWGLGINPTEYIVDGKTL